MKPKHRPSRKLWNRPTGTANRLPRSCRSVTKPCSIRSGSTALPKPKGTTNCLPERSSFWPKPFSVDQNIEAHGRDVRGLPFLQSSRALNLRDRQRDGTALAVATRRPRDGDRVDSRRRSADRCLRRRSTTRWLEQEQRKQSAQHENSQDTPAAPVASDSHTQHRQSRNRQPEPIKAPQTRRGRDHWPRRRHQVERGRPWTPYQLD